MLKKNLFVVFVLLGVLLMNPRLVLTDGTDTINLLGCVSGYDVDRWFQQFAQYKGGGVLQNSSLANGQRIIDHRFDSITDEFPLTMNDTTNDGFAYTQQELSRMLERAAAYWENDWNSEPVWLERRAPCETETSYALVNYGSILEFADQMNEDFALDSAQGPLALRINHGLWMSHEPFDSECVELSAEQDYTLAELTVVSSPVAGTDDAQYRPNNNLWQPTTAAAGFGNAGGESFESGIRFPNITIPQGATILSASIQFRAQVIGPAASCSAIIKGELVANAPTFSTAKDYASRVGQDGPQQYWDTVTWIAGNLYYTPDIAGIIQDIVDQPTWANGNALVIFMQDAWSANNGNRRFDTVETGGGTPAVLTIRYANADVSFGRSATCD